MKPLHSLCRAGLGLRREHLQSMACEVTSTVQFLEVAPENWIKAPKQRRELLAQILKKNTAGLPWAFPVTGRSCPAGHGSAESD